MNFSDDVICPNCKENETGCDSCENGKIPARVLKFINEKMFENGDYYCCEYHLKPFNQRVSLVEIRFKIHKETYEIYGLSFGNQPPLKSNTTVGIVDEMLKNYSIEGMYFKD